MKCTCALHCTCIYLSVGLFSEGTCHLQFCMHGCCVLTDHQITSLDLCSIPYNNSHHTAWHLFKNVFFYITASASTDPLVMSNYRAGFNECLHEVSRFLRTGEHVNSAIKEQMMSHLANCVNQVPSPKTDIDRSRLHERHAEQRSQLRGYVYSTDPAQSQMCGIPNTCNTQLAALPGYTGYMYGQEQYLLSDGEESRHSFYGDYSKDIVDDQSTQHFSKLSGCYSMERTSPMSASEDVKPVMRNMNYVNRPSLSPGRPGSAGGLSDSMWRPWWLLWSLSLDIM